MDFENYTPEQARALLPVMMDQLRGLRIKEAADRYNLKATLKGIKKTQATIEALEKRL